MLMRNNNLNYKVIKMKNELNKLIEDIKIDYYNWTKRVAIASGKGELSNINREMINEFDEGMAYKEGNKYIKILKGRSVWGFVVNIDDDKLFRKGDILKAAGYNTPARNKPRGNLFDGYNINWTGPNYIK
tara:strand:- start:581 stop:970 length:390 start_codon:yes stop_codon:yes gene_type:complete